MENPKPHGKSYNKWLGDQAKPSHRELLRVAIDNALSQSPANFEELLKLLQESGCEVSKRGKSYCLKLPGWEKAARMDSLGEGYGLEDLQAVLSVKKAHTPRKKTVTQAEPPKVNLLVDIQAKLQAGKGAGYARWAKVFNLKQMAQTMNYLSEHNLLEYAILEEKAAVCHIDLTGLGIIYDVSTQNSNLCHALFSRFDLRRKLIVMCRGSRSLFFQNRILQQVVL